MRLYYIFFLVFLAGSCVDEARQQMKKQMTEGKAIISVDEAYKPFMAEVEKVFEASYPKAELDIRYKSEAECLKDLKNDSVKMIIISRPLAQGERNIVENRKGFSPKEERFAYDAVALISNKSSGLTHLKLQEVEDILSGKNKQYTVTMDGLSATGTIKYALDSILRGKSLSPDIMGAKNTQEVIEYVSETPNSIGFVGMSWLANQDDPEQKKILEKVNRLGIECKNCDKKQFFEPIQQNINYNGYPYVRPIYYVVKEYHGGIASNLANFLQYERGQLLIKRSYLVPGQMDFSVRKVKLK